MTDEIVYRNHNLAQNVYLFGYGGGHMVYNDENEPTTSSVDSSLPVEQQKEAATDGSSSSEQGDDESDRFETRRETRGRGSVQCRICQKVS